MSNNATLYDNLQNLMKLHGGLSVSELARKTHLPQPTLHHILDGTTKNPRKKALKALANYFSITISQLIGETPLPSVIPDSIKSTLNITTVPVIEWKDIKKFRESNIKTNVIKEIILEKLLDKASFALFMPNSSMEPLFPENSVLIFDPSRTPKDRDFALVYLSNSDCYVFNRYFIDGSSSYIKQDQHDGNAQLIKLTSNDEVVAKLTEVRAQF